MEPQLLKEAVRGQPLAAKKKDLEWAANVCELLDLGGPGVHRMSKWKG